MAKYPRHTTSAIPVIVGPTASGKTDISLALGELLNGEIISADSRQVYKYLDIGTAKPTVDQRRRLRHHFVDELHPDQPFNAGIFGAEGRKRIAEIFTRKKMPIVVGGSGLYVRSLIDGLFEGPSSDPETRLILEQRVRDGRTAELVEELRQVDPNTAARADVTKPRRIIRALEVYYLTGKPLSLHHTENRPDITFTAMVFGLKWERKELYRRIEDRCDAMIRDGLLDEIEMLETMGCDRRLNALNTVGYAEGFAYRAGEISHMEMVRLFKQNSRRYAKRQLTWFRADKRVRWIPVDTGVSTENVASEIAEQLLPNFS